MKRRSFVQASLALGSLGSIASMMGCASTGRIPEKGEAIRLSDDWEFEILDADRRRIKLVKLRKPEAPRNNPAEAPV